MSSAGGDEIHDVGARWFATTHWSVVLAAGHPEQPGAQQALETLCRGYWYPLYTYVRRQGHTPEDAQDLVQEFFARLLEKKCLRVADPARGRFRTFLLTALHHFLGNEWKKASCQKRGGSEPRISLNALEAERRYALEPVDELTPEKIFEKRWAATLLERVLALLGGEYAAAGKARLFTELKAVLWGEKNGVPYAQIAADLGMTEAAFKMATHRLRQRYGQWLRAEIAQTVARPEEVEEELRYLVALLAG